jgi:protein disulfide-isomerase-like protein
MSLFGLKINAPRITPVLMVLVAIGAVALAIGAVALWSEKYQKDGFDAAGKTLVLYFAPWCGHCKALKPEWEKLEAAGIKGVSIRKVNAEEEKDEAREAGVEGYPTIIYYNNGKKQVYSGARTADAISAWVAAN